jgi:biopolymer transport protein ExbD
MALLRKRQSRGAEIPTSSMADISFLLLLFFLVTTTIDVDTGIGLVLPPPIEEGDITKVNPENMIRVLVNASGEVLLDDEVTAVPQIHEIVSNKLRQKNKIISVKTDRNTPYSVYIATLDEIKQAYNTLREEYAMRTFSLPINALSEQQMDEVRDAVKQSISIAEPERTR